MRKLMLMLAMVCLLMSSAQAETITAIYVTVTEGAMGGVGLRNGVDAELDAMCIRDFDGDGEISQSELNERIDCTWYAEDESIDVQPAHGFMEWYEADKAGFRYPTANMMEVPASADGKRIWCRLTDQATGETRTIQYTLHLNGVIAQTPDITPQPVDLGGNKWELQVEEGTEVSIHLNDSLRETWDGELSYRWYKTRFEKGVGSARSTPFENNSDSLTFTASMEDHGWVCEWHIKSQNHTTGEYAGHAGQLLIYVYPKGQKPVTTPVSATGTIPCENGRVLFSVYRELSENAQLPYSLRSEWFDRLMIRHGKGLTFRWTSEDEPLQAILDQQQGTGMHLVFDLDETTAARLNEDRIPLTCTIADETTGEILAHLTYTITQP